MELLAERVIFIPGAVDLFPESQLNIMASFAQLERANIEELQADGASAAKQRVIHQGRGRQLTDDQLPGARHFIKTGVSKQKSPAGSASAAPPCTVRSRDMTVASGMKPKSRPGLDRHPSHDQFEELLCAVAGLSWAIYR